MGRPADMIARYGGEEFILILPDTGQDGVVRLGEKIRRAVEELGIEHLLREADIALYRAKRVGRNQVQSAPGVSWGASSSVSILGKHSGKSSEPYGIFPVPVS